MFSIFSPTLANTKNGNIVSKEQRNNRRYPRRKKDNCVIIIDGVMHPVEDWSSGGALLIADDRLYSLDQDHNLTLKFKLRNSIIEVKHKAKIIRKTPNKIALQFLPLTNIVKSSFQKVIDDYVSKRFAESQSS